MNKKDPDQAAPDEARERAQPASRDNSTHNSRHDQTKRRPERIRLADQSQGTVFNQIRNIARRSGSIRLEEPADMGMPRACNQTAHAAAMCVGRMRVALFIRVMMMPAVQRNPPEQR